MSTTDTIRAQPSLKALCALIAGCTMAAFTYRSLQQPLWSDEILTTSLLKANSLPKLWSGIALGIDANPPLYMTAAWLLVQAIPKALASSVALLRLFNLAIVVGATFMLYRTCRRIASAHACWIALLLFATLNSFNVVFVAFEVRTYALYLLMTGLAVLLQQRLIERRGRADTLLLALAYVGLTLSHTFGIVYVGCIALAGALSALGAGRSCLRPIAFAVAPSIIVLAGWSPFLIGQLGVAKPYAWIAPPDLPELLQVLFASKLSMCVAMLELGCLASALVSGVGHKEFQLRPVIRDPQWQPVRYATLIMLGITGITLAGWVVSILFFPLFVPRYFVPQLIASFALHAAFAEWLLRQQRVAIVAASAIVAPVMLLNVMLHLESPIGPICTDRDGHFFEAGFVHGDLPVIAESPQIFLPRATYADHGSAYRFPLDWQVVLNYPQRSRGNAVDFHIMQNLQSWAPMPSVISTDDIVRNFPQFLVIEQPERAWFHNLRTTRNVAAEKLAESVASDPHEPLCALWKVTSVKNRP
jgi:hypothetical protein